MRIPLASWILVAAAGLPGSAVGGAPDLAGDWDTIIEAPKRPWVLVTRFTRDGEAWNGTLRLEGFGEFALRDVTVDESRLRFRLPPELDSLAFEGAFTDSVIDGQVLDPEHPIAARLTRIPPLPHPANRAEAWRQDLEFAATRMAAYDRSFDDPSRDAFQRALAAIDPERESDAQILVALSRAIALADNAHTRMRLDRTRGGTFAQELPIRLWWFDEGPYVISAAPEYRRALGARVLAVDGHDVHDARQAVARLFAGNEAWGDYFAPIYLTNPDVLYGLGWSHSPDRAEFTLESPRGQRFSITVRSRPKERDTRPGESWQELSPRAGHWAHALSADEERLPLYLRHPEKAYWFQPIADGVLYFQFNRSGDDEAGPPFQQFADSLLTFARSHPIRDVVIDLRFNSGGNLDVARSFMQKLGDEPAVNRRGHLFVITGHCTFSAGLFHAAQLKQFTAATFVGEPVGDRLDFWAEGGKIVLPNSGAGIRYSNGFHGYSGRDYPRLRPYYEELSISTLDPDIPAPLRAADYFSGHDPAMRAIEARARP